MARPLRLLMIEDSDDDAALLLREVRRGGYEPYARRVDDRASLEEALDQSWDIILCDCRMPGLDATTAVAIVRAHKVETPCIVVSGTVGEEYAVSVMRSGAQDFVLKDNLMRLLPAIDRELRDSEVRIKQARAESTLRATEAGFRAAFELIPDGVIVHRAGIVIHANGSAASLLAASSADALMGRAVLDLFATSERAAVGARMRDIESSSLRPGGAAGAPTPLAEQAMLRLDGRILHVETTAMSVFLKGQPAILIVIRDVSARREVVARTIQVDRMLAVGTLAAGVGHEINNPLAYVMANVAYASEEVSRVQRELEKIGENDPSSQALATSLSEVVSILGEVSEGAHRIRDIARDLNTFARDSGDLSDVDMCAAADSALRMAAAEIRQRARVVRRYEDVPRVRANASRVSQVLLNLVINAAQSIPTGSAGSNEITIRIRRRGDSVVVEVSDTGCGIAPENRDRLFTPFFTTKPLGQGIGLGLSISQRIVRQLGGEIEIESATDRGTTARVILPALREDSAEGLATPIVSKRRGRLLFVDDEGLLGAAFQRALSREHDVLVVDSNAAALTRIAAGEKFDVIFCDLNMPLETGMDFYEAVRDSSSGQAARIVMMSGRGYGPRTKRVIESGEMSVLDKPLDLDQVRALLVRKVST